MRLEEMQAGTQSPNLYHSMQADRMNASQNTPDKQKSISTEQLSTQTSSITMQKPEPTNRDTTPNRRVGLVQNDTLQSRNNDENNPLGAKVDLSA